MKCKKVIILTPQNPWRRGFNDFYPLVKWKSQLKEKKYEFKFINDEYHLLNINFDIAIIDYRYFADILKKGENYEIQLIQDYLCKIKKKSKVIYFDTADSSGSRSFSIINTVDLFIKKQILIEKDYYSYNNGKKSERLWISENNEDKSDINYYPCSKENLSKIHLGWNIGLCDYRSFYLGRYLPFSTNNILNNFYKRPVFYNPNCNRKYVTTFRGNINSNNSYSFQRNIIIKYLKTKNENKYITGNIVSRQRYLNELRNSLSIISPFGWGEICYRDFETIISGALLLKPSLNHLDTFPNIFVEYETYIPLNWTLDDLNSKIVDIEENCQSYLGISNNAQRLYLEHFMNPQYFIRHFCDIINKL